jgi:hypothetical protein
MASLRQAKPAASAYFPSVFVAIPVEFFDACRASKFCSDLQARFIQLIGRHTWSVASVNRKAKTPLEWTAKPWTAAHVARELGTDVDSAQWIIANAVKRGLVSRRRVAGVQGFCYKTHPDMWAAADAWVPPKREEVEEETPPAEVVEIPAAVVAPGLPGRPVTVRAGRTASLKLSVERVEKVTYSSEGLAPFDAVAAFSDGVLSLQFSASKTVEKTAGANKTRIGAKLRNGLRSFFALKTHLEAIFAARCYGPLTDELFTSICNHLGPETSEQFAINFIDEKLIEKRQKRYNITPGLFEAFASDARYAWDNQKRPTETGGAPGPDPAERLRILTFALEELAENSDDPAAKTIVESAHSEELAAARAMVRPGKSRPAPVKRTEVK